MKDEEERNDGRMEGKGVTHDRKQEAGDQANIVREKTNKTCLW